MLTGAKLKRRNRERLRQAALKIAEQRGKDRHELEAAARRAAVAKEFAAQNRNAVRSRRDRSARVEHRRRETRGLSANSAGGAQGAHHSFSTRRVSRSGPEATGTVIDDPKAVRPTIRLQPTEEKGAPSAPPQDVKVEETRWWQDTVSSRTAIPSSAPAVLQQRESAHSVQPVSLRSPAAQPCHLTALSRGLLSSVGPATRGSGSTSAKREGSAASRKGPHSQYQDNGVCGEAASLSGFSPNVLSGNIEWQRNERANGTKYRTRDGLGGLLEHSALPVTRPAEEGKDALNFFTDRTRAYLDALAGEGPLWGDSDIDEGISSEATTLQLSTIPHSPSLLRPPFFPPLPVTRPAEEGKDALNSFTDRTRASLDALARKGPL